MTKEKQIEEMFFDVVKAFNYARDFCAEQGGCDICENRKYGKNCDFASMTENLYNAGYRKQEWISVGERLPDGYGVFLVAVKVKLLWKTEWEYCVDMARFNVSKIPSVNGWDYESGDGYEYIVTHWMPLPEAPKMKGGVTAESAIRAVQEAALELKNTPPDILLGIGSTMQF